MASEVHQPNNGGTSYNHDHMFSITMVVASAQNNQPIFAPFPFPIYSKYFCYDDVCHEIVITFLESVMIPPTYFNGGGCNMVENLSRMLRNATLQHHNGLHLCIVMMVLDGSSQYKILNSSQPFLPEQFSSTGSVKLACEGGECSYPASRVEDGEDKCAICFEGYPSHMGPEMLPCSHVFHQSCLMRWFRRNPTCPQCRFIVPSCYLY